jgi:hypothetical protein
MVKVFLGLISSQFKRKLMQDKVIPKYGHQFFINLIILAILSAIKHRRKLISNSNDV